jgi:hypothetical protein
LLAAQEQEPRRCVALGALHAPGCKADLCSSNICNTCLSLCSEELHRMPSGKMPPDKTCNICDLTPFAAFAYLSAPPDLGSHAEDQQEARTCVLQRHHYKPKNQKQHVFLKTTNMYACSGAIIKWLCEICRPSCRPGYLHLHALPSEGHRLKAASVPPTSSS